MGRFNGDIRKTLPNQIARHFDKYIEFVNPLTFCPLQDLYRHAFTEDEWRSLNYLLERDIGRDCLAADRKFTLVMSEGKESILYYRDHVVFWFPDEVLRPPLEIELDRLPYSVQEKLLGWLKKSFAYQRLRRELRTRIEALLDWGWLANQSYDSSRGSWRGGPTPGQGCNTIGQVYRVWPELLPFFPPEEVAVARNASVKSRLPDFIMYEDEQLTVGQFVCKERLFYCDTDKAKPYTDQEMQLARRRFKAISHILVQMSLMKDVEHVKNYPEVFLAYS